MKGAVDDGTTATAPLNARDFRLELVERLAPTFGRAFEHRLRLSGIGDRISLHHLHQRAASGGAQRDLPNGAEQRSPAAWVDYIVVDRQTLRRHDLGERSFGPC